MARKEKVRYLKEKGVTQIISVKDQKQLERNKGLEYYKDILYQCGKCGTCRTAYHEPNWNKVCPSGEFSGFEAYYLGGKNLLSWAIESQKLPWSENLAKIFYQCSVCLACTQQCQIPEIHHYAGEWLMAMREKAVEKGFGPMPEQKNYTEHIKKHNNPYMEVHQDRLNWNLENVKINNDSDMAYFVGCTSSYREQNVAKATVSILNKLNLDFTILTEERCCGSPVYMTGQSQEAENIAKTNVKTYTERRIKRIITSCAGCYRMWKDVYPRKFGLDHQIEILHLPEFILTQHKKGNFNFKSIGEKVVTYHDPCHIGRHLGIYEPPRELIKLVPGIELVEMERNRENSWCCGSGGGVRSSFKELSSFAAETRIKEAKDTNAESIISCCPFCLNQFKTNIRDDGISAQDISELIDKAL